MAEWAEERGFRAAVVERRFGPNFRIGDEEPEVALCGVDNPQARAALEDVGFKRVVEAGLGRGYREYLAFQAHTFPARRSAKELWGGLTAASVPEELRQKPAYQALEAAGADQCGVTLLAGRAVGASFVGAAISTLVISEFLRMTVGAPGYELIDGTLRALEHRQVFAGEELSEPFNPGLTKAAPLALG